MANKIYLIEDEETVRISLIEIIENYLEEVEVVGFSETGMEGLNECLKLKPDLVIVDIMLPDTNGLEVLQGIKEKSPQTKVIMHSGYLVLNIAKLAYEQKADGILEKPSEAEEIKTAINTVLSGETYYSKNILEKIQTPESSAPFKLRIP